MTEAIVVALIGLGGTLVLALVALLNLATNRRLLIRVGRQLEIAESQAEMTLIRNAFVEMSEFLQIFVERPHLRPFFYEGREFPTGDEGLDNEVAAMAEWVLTNFATAISLAVMLPEYPIGALKETIRFHLRSSPVMRRHVELRFAGFPVTGLTLLRWTYDTKAETMAALERILAQCKDDPQEEARVADLVAFLRASPENADLLFAVKGLSDARAGAIRLEAPTRRALGLRLF